MAVDNADPAAQLDPTELSMALGRSNVSAIQMLFGVYVCWWWEAYEALRRLILTGGLLFFQGSACWSFLHSRSHWGCWSRLCGSCAPARWANCWRMMAPSVAEACPFHLPVELWAHALSFVVEENRTVVDGLQVRFD